MVKGSMRHGASVWCFLLLLASGLGRPHDEQVQEKNAPDAVLQAETARMPMNSSEEVSTIRTLQTVPFRDATTTADLVENPQNDTDGLSRGIDAFDDVLVKAGEKETVVITDAGGEYEDEQDHEDDLLLMEARSLATDGQTAAAPHLQEKVFHNGSTPRQDTRLKDFLGLSGALDLNETDTGAFTMNVASLLANDYKEMYELMHQKLSGGEDASKRSSSADPGVPTDSQEPRGMDGGRPSHASPTTGKTPLIADDVQSSGSAPQPVYVPAPPALSGWNDMRRLRPVADYPRHSIGARPRLQPGRPPNDRSDAALPLTLYSARLASKATARPPRKTDSNSRPPFAVRGPMIYVPTETITRLQRLPSLPAGQRPATTLRSRPQPPENATSTTKTKPFPFVFGRRLPRPTQYAANISTPVMLQQSQADSRSPQMYFHSSAVPVVSASSQISPVMRLAPNLYYLRQPGQMARTRNQLGTQTAPVPSVTPQSAPVSNTQRSKSPPQMEFGARLRPMIPVRAAASKAVDGETFKAAKEQREAKINQLRSNLVGKLVVIQSMLEGKQARSEKTREKGNDLSTPHRGGFLKPIKTLRPPTKPASATSANPITPAAVDEFAVEANEPMSDLRDTKKYRRPPSLRKSDNIHKSSAEVRNEDDGYEGSASVHQSVVESNPNENSTVFSEFKNSTSQNFSSVVNHTASWSGNITDGTAENSTSALDVVSERTLNGNQHGKKNLPLNSTKAGEWSSQSVDKTGNSEVRVSVEKEINDDVVNWETLSTSNNAGENSSTSRTEIENVEVNISTEETLIADRVRTVNRENSSTITDQVGNVELYVSTEGSLIADGVKTDNSKNSTTIKDQIGNVELNISTDETFTVNSENSLTAEDQVRNAELNISTEETLITGAVSTVNSDSLSTTAEHGQKR